MQTLESPFEITHEARKGHRYRLAARDQHIIETRAHLITYCPQGGPQAAANAIAFDRIPCLLRDGEANARRASIVSFSRLHEKWPRRRAQSIAGGEEIRSSRQAVHDDSEARAKSSGRKPLTAACTARRKHSTSTFGRHARAKSMPALADELARLIRPFHVFSPGLRRI